MTRTTSITAALLLALSTGSARAETPTTSPVTVEGVPSAVVEAPTVDPNKTPEAKRMRRAKFSGKRLALEILAGEATAVLASYGTFAALCDGNDCFGAAFASLGAELALSPLAIYGTGRALGGRGKLSHTYLGAVPAFAAFSAPAPVDATPAETLTHIKIQLTLASIFLPVTSALMFELSSHVQAAKWAREHSVQLSIKPVHGRERVEGAMGFVSAEF